jgi:hypothetical protein
MKKNTNVLVLVAVLTSATLFTSCGDDDFGQPSNGRDGIISSQSDADLVPEDLSGDITGDITLDAGTNWLLTGPLAVKNGATLTIEAGATIKASAGGTNVYVVIETGAQIMATGTAENPITFTSSASNPRNGDWGGILINGLAPISGGGTSTTEVLPLSYGGSDATDNSGVFKYVMLEYTGARINGEKEFNGLTLYAVGTGTEINNIVVNGGDDDGIEFFGGTVEVDNLLIINARDDMFDWTQGYTGGGSNWYGIRENGFSSISEDTRGIEGDGNLDGLNPSQNGQSNPTVDKLTIVNGAYDPPIEFADIIKIRRGSMATITNAMFALIEDGGDFGTFSDLIDLTDSKGDAGDGTSISYWVNDKLDTNGDAVDTKRGENNTTISTNAASTGADESVFSWTGYSFPTLTAASSNN